MNRFVIKEKCDGCNGKFLCVADCVTSFIDVREENDKKRAVFKERGYCIDCGHCNAICPQNAIGGIKVNDVIENDLLNFFAMKRTVRAYNNEKEISKNDIDLIIKAGQSAPTEKNKGTVRIYLIKEQLKELFLDALEILKKHVEQVGSLHPQYRMINELYKNKSPIFWGAEYAVFIVGKNEFSVDAALAAERMQLMAHSLNIASGYNGNFKFAVNNSEELKDRIGISPKEEVLVCFALGNTLVKYCLPYISEKKKVIFM